MMRCSDVLRRGLDLVGAVVGLALLAPVLLGVAGLILLTMGAPVLFRQVRPGLGGKPIVAIDDADSELGFIIRKESIGRIVPSGKVNAFVNAVLGAKNNPVP